MNKYSKINVISNLQRWMESENGQTFMNYAYSWGASIVILGTLFKLTHLSGANLMLFIGMGTEVFVFFIAAFDRPFVKETEVKENEEVQRHGTVAVQLMPESEELNRPVDIAADDENTKKLREVSDSICDAYRKQLAKLYGQLDSIDKIEEQMKIQAACMTELNKIYGRMLDAVKVKE